MTPRRTFAVRSIILTVAALLGLWFGLSTSTTAQNAAMMFLSSNTGGAQPASTAELARMPAATTTTARSLSSVLMIERSSRWSAVSAPAVSTLASASIAAEAGVRHVADCVAFAAGSTTAPALTNLTINLRDGATGAGTIIGTWTVVASAATGQNITPFTTCGLNLAGTTNTAMTLEFSALLTSLFESVTLTGFNIQ